MFWYVLAVGLGAALEYFATARERSLTSWGSTSTVTLSAPCRAQGRLHAFKYPPDTQ
jgi:hypothetical protein